MNLIQDLGMRFAKPTNKQKRRFGIYKCPICFNNFEACIYDINSKRTTQCKECNLNKNIISDHKLYSIWDAEKQRCNNKNNKTYKHYGARGIKVSDEFHNFNIWLKYVESLDNAYKKSYTIDRINNDKNYERGNLRWSSKSTQARNTRRIYKHNTSGFRGVTYDKSRNKWIAKISINNKTIGIGRYRIKLDAAKAYDEYIITHNLEHTRNGVLSIDFIK